MKRSSMFPSGIDLLTAAILAGQATARVLALSTVLALAWPGAALAQSEDFDRNGVYLGLGMAGAVYTEVGEEIEKTSSHPRPVDVGIPVGLDTRVGYRFHPRLAGEVQLQWLPGDIRSDFIIAGMQVDDAKGLLLDTLTLTGNVKGYLLTGELQPYLMTGIGFMHFDAKDRALGLSPNGLGPNGDAFAARFGGGLEYYWIRNLVLSLETSYVLPTGVADALDQVTFSFGMLYRF